MNKIRKKIIVNESYRSSSSSSGSDTEIAYDLTVGNDIDLGSYSGNLIINITSVMGTATLNSFSNFTNVKKVTLRPPNGIILTINDANAIGSGNIYLYAPQLVIDGANKGFLELQRRANGTGYGMFETNFVDSYNPIV